MRESAAVPRSLKVENMTDSIRHHSSARAGRGVPVHIVRIARLARLVVDREIRHVDTCVRTRYTVHSRARALEAFQGRLEQLALLWIHIRGFEVVNTEKVIVELAYIFVDEVAAGHVRATAAVAALWMIEAIDIVSIRWNRSLSYLLVDN